MQRDKSKTKRGGPHYINRYDSWGEFLAVAESPVTDLNESSRASQRPGDYGGSRFYNSRNFAEAVQFARFGWPKGPKAEVNAVVENIRSEMKDLTVDTFNMAWDVEGGAVDVAAFLEGVPENMIRLEPVKIAKPGRVVTIIVAGTVSAAMDRQDYIRKGSAVCGLIEALELTQTATELFIEFTVNGSRFGGAGGTHTSLVKVKTADERLDRERMLFIFANPDVLRRICFSVQEHEPKAIRQMFGFEGGGYGSAPYDCTQHKEVGATVVLNEFSYRETPVEWVRKNLVEFGLIEAGVEV